MKLAILVLQVSLSYLGKDSLAAQEQKRKAWQLFSGAVSISLATGENEIIPLDLISKVSFKLNEQGE